MRTRAIIYDQYGEEVAELSAHSEQALTEEIGSELHQMLVSDATAHLTFRITFFARQRRTEQ